MLRLFNRPFVRLLAPCALIVALLLSPSRSYATIFVFQQTGETVPGLDISASISVNSQLSALPTINSLQSPINFGNLLSFTLTGPTGTFTLADFTPTCLSGSCFGFPSWSISPSAISFIDATDSRDFFINGFGSTSTIQVDTDAPTLCHLTGACIATGDWVPVPEPSAASIFVAAFLTLIGIRRQEHGTIACVVKLRMIWLKKLGLAAIAVARTRHQHPRELDQQPRPQGAMIDMA